MDDKNRIIERIKKLFLLSKSSNENEAFLALKKANELMRQYSIQYKDVYITEKYPSTHSARVSKWRNEIGFAVAWLNGVLFLKTPRSYLFTGGDLEVEVSCQMYDYLEKSILRIAKLNVRKNAKYKYRESFRMGMAVSLRERIHEMGSEASWLPDREETIKNIKEALKGQIKPHDDRRKKKGSGLNKEAFWRGIAASEDIGLNLQVNNGRGKAAMIKAG